MHHDKRLLVLTGTPGMTGAGLLLGASLLVPIGMMLTYLSPRHRERIPGLLALAPVPALVAALLASGGTLVLPRVLLRLTLALDVPGAALLLGVAALLWIAAGFYASAWLRGKPDRGRFVVWWLLTLTGSLGVFMAADLVSFYLLFSLVSLAAYGLIVHDGTPCVRRAGAVYVTLALLSEAFLLMGFVLLAQATPGDSLLIRDAVAALPASPSRDPTLTLLILGFGLKIGLVPLHVWMPLAYLAAPMPAAAVLSGAAVKAGVIGLIRFLPFDVALPGWGAALATVGLISAFYGVLVGITQTNPKTVLAYSSVSQMGVLAAVLGMGLMAGDNSVAFAAAFYAAHHVLVKGGLFLAVGVTARTGAGRRWPVLLLPAAVLALGLAGLPLTGGALAKLAVKGFLGSGIVGLLGTLSAAGTTLLMLHFLGRLARTATDDGTQREPASLVVSWLATAFAAIAVPWTVYLVVWGGTLSEVFAPATLWTAAWPLLVGSVLAIALWYWGARLPSLPAGDVVVVAERGASAIKAAGRVFDHLDGVLRQWPVAGVALLALVVALGAAILAGP